MKGIENQKEKTILMLSWEYPPHIIGGLARHVHALATELGNRNQQIHVLTSRPDDSREYDYQGNVHIHRVNPINDQDTDFLSWMAGLNVAIIEEVLNIANHIKFDLVHTHDWMTGPAAKFLSKKLEIPLIATVHGTEFGRNKGIFSDLQQFISKKEKELCRDADEIIVCSDFMEAEILSLFEVPNNKISVIPNGAMSEKLEQPPLDIEELYPFLKGKKMVYSIGRIVKEKGFQTLIAAADLLKMKVEDLCFVVAGNGPLLEWYRQKVKELGLDGFVHFIGFVNEDIRNSLMMRADIAVFASSYEPFGLAAAETLAAGVPTVVAKTGGMQTLIEDYKTGFYMQPGDEKNLVRIIEWILENEACSEEIGRNALESINEKFSWAQNARATDTLYIRALSKNCQKEGIK
ncbi:MULTISPECIES: glycosyltransferase family 4 protein [unclassified Bacillus (in: firmicutes)]|uniref:glycosyltransferase family 4 protein n=1 Tax=unclassified Bacillus (in: firmicutes) TaxID=185979 RepID=UPI001BE93FC2|nr:MULTISPECIES: glycosyltransferase family 4 protein [unclassified Bacillus (in: firmicutes)]MBT2636544.1 glycosyltransferase family 4 protein [Bacillus sp. ISL-39]MBT2660808.1 glycosyltransferase family 4 protein [Bacillus sp. ISL-45]